MKIEGTLEHFNYSPKGGYEAMMLSTAKGPVQVNFPPEQAVVLAAVLTAGATVKLKADLMENAHGVPHQVYELAAVTWQGKTLDLEPTVEVTGQVTRLNHSRHGEINGAVLDTGDFVHLKPHGARATHLELGQTLTVAGRVRSTQFGNHRAIEAETANGVDLQKLEHARKAAKKAAKKASSKKA